MSERPPVPQLDIDATARALSVPVEAVEVCHASEIIDLHVDSFIWSRIGRYDLTRRHQRQLFGRRYLGHVDFPRAIESGLTGAMWAITTNPLRTAHGRRQAFARNVARLKATIAEGAGIELVRSVAEYRQARARHNHGAFLAVQGGHAIDDPATVADDLVRTTLVHLTSTVVGETSSPLRRSSRVRGLTAAGRTYVEACNQYGILVDLAHASPECFWDAVDVHDPDRPLIVTHTGVSGVYPSWRNLDDDQLRAVADRGGCVGVMLHEQFLGRNATAETVADHLDHISHVAGDDVPAIGTDLDGMVVPPEDLQGYHQLPRLVHALMARGWSTERITKALGTNALRTIEAVRG